MSYSNKDIANLLVDFLSTAIEKKAVSSDNADSLNVAIDCITEAFEFEKDDVKSTLASKFGGKSLTELLDAATNAKGRSSSPEDIKVSISDKDEEEDKELAAKAEALKLEGNKAMAAKDYNLAVEKYNAAIKLVPTKAVYYANRAAAYSSQEKYDEAIKDAESAIKVEPNWSKGYSRLGFAKFAQGKSQEALEAYKKALEVDGDKATDIMKRDYETAKKKVEQSLNVEKSATPSASASASASAGGMPDMASMLGGGLGSFLNNPQIMQAAQQMMSNPRAMEQMESMMQNPSIRQMAENLSSGSSEGMGDFMNNPAIREMASNLFGGAGAGAGADSNGANSSANAGKDADKN
ncbi:hypothetical protein TBLA_0G01050 [Henningerozyma blattae CBS 6284]|uniref:SGTA homodimerisation domain-containing protein n=1 Tax=Henningerozyma blattae (strain ATCC 34711 / CBS 6284 / DSM 70876 / NBRC 10599 / NRRL Y-10934 / UCD 77-7) TaxID=1071380 RepID=I2H6Q0_HENB6|nr:hypothetical protein TBLA_0G01050 [Tetrapisispora blattae CBS 6284]CCH62052.1 hypothetical protein TBLA_0G01050 [Tetrapisispora blattae CBS 6284]